MYKFDAFYKSAQRRKCMRAGVPRLPSQGRGRKKYPNQPMMRAGSDGLILRYKRPSWRKAKSHRKMVKRETAVV